MSRSETEPLLLKHGQLAAINDGGNDGDHVLQDEVPTKNQLGALNGVYVPCLLNILGAVLFMKLGYSVGYAGWFGTLCIFVFSEWVTIMTALSFSAIVTNGRMKGGGAYFMISRSIGPAFGSATGIMFYCCYVANAAFNAQAFVLDITSTFLPHLTGDKLADYTYYIYHVTLFVLLLVAYAGAGAFAKVNIFLFVTLITSILISFGSLLFGHEKHLGTYSMNSTIDVPTCPFSDPQIPGSMSGTIDVTYYPPAAHRFRSNFWPAESPDFWSSATSNNMQVVMAMIFSSTCGVMEGANLSGDLKNPAQALPKGTLLAKTTSFSTYIIFCTILALCFDRTALMCDFNVVQNAALSKYIVVTGIAMATLSTSLGALFGAARILQAIARDDCFPFSFFKKGTLKGDEPRRAVVFTYLLANAFIYGSGQSLNDIANLLTDFFLTAYAFVNLSQTLLAFSRSPNYRPTFNWTSWHISLLAFLSTMALMWFLNPLYAAITCTTWICIFTGIIFFSKEGRMKDWGDVSQAIRFRAIVTLVKGLLPKKEHVKFWRPKILVLSQDVDLPMLTFCSKLAKNGLLVLGAGHVDGASVPSTAKTMAVLPKFEHPLAVTKSVWLWVSEYAKLQATVQVGAGSRLADIYRTMVSCVGLGTLVPNTIALPYKDRGSAAPDVDYVGRINEQLQVLGQSTDNSQVVDETVVNAILWHPPAYNSTLKGLSNLEYVMLLQHTLDLEKNVMVLRNLGSLETLFASVSLKRTTGMGNLDNLAEAGIKTTGSNIDVWILGEWTWDTQDDAVSILLQHAHLMKQALGKDAKLRVIQLVRFFSTDDQSRLKDQLKELVVHARVPRAHIEVLPADYDLDAGGKPFGEEMSAVASPNDFSKLNRTIKEQSSSTAMTFLALPKPPSQITGQSAEDYLEKLDTLTNDLPPLALLRKGEPGALINADI